MTKPKRFNVCCNPFDKHQNETKNLRLINLHLVKEAKRLNITLKEGNFLCDRCRLQIVKSASKKRKLDSVCCNPLSIHAGNVKKKLRKVNSDFIEKAKKLNITIEYGQSICDT